MKFYYANITLLVATIAVVATILMVVVVVMVVATIIVIATIMVLGLVLDSVTTFYDLCTLKKYHGHFGFNKERFLAHNLQGINNQDTVVFYLGVQNPGYHKIERLLLPFMVYY
ncbi:hypothetical protein BDF21DRAFT_403737 [Thamnidium elegans]|nr:hypothetical protein BDF21DRAFT_403737 [Thamnidium elegans]